MILERLYVKGAIGIEKGIGKDEIEIDFTKFNPGVVGVIGPTGCGKTTIMELASPYRKLFTRDGSIHNHFKENGKKIFECQMNGHSYRSEMLFGGNSMKAYLYKDNSPDPLNDKLDEYDAVVDSIFGDFHSYKNSAFAPQGNHSIIEQKDSDLRDIFMKVFNLERYTQEYLPIAKEQISSINDRIQKEKAAMDAYSEDIEQIDFVENAIDSLKAELPGLIEACELYNKAIEKTYKEIEEEKEKIRQKKSDSEKTNRLDEELDKMKINYNKYKRDHSEDLVKIEKQIASNLRDIEDSEKQIKKEKEDIVRAKKIIDNQEDIKNRYNKYQKDRSLLNNYDNTLEVVDGLRSKKHGFEVRLADIESRLKSGRVFVTQLMKTISVLDDVPCQGTDYYSKCPLLLNAHSSKKEYDNAVAEGKLLKKTKEEIELELDYINKELGKYATVNDDVKRLKQEIKQYEDDGWLTVYNEIEQSKKAYKKFEETVALLENRIVNCKDIEGDLESNLKEKSKALENELSKRMSEIKDVEKEIEDLRKDFNVFDHERKIESLEYEQASHRSDEARVKDKIGNVNGQIKVYEEDLKILYRKKQSVDDIKKSLAVYLKDIDEWKLIEKACKDIPVIELESASGLVTNYANQQLSNAFNYNLSVKLITSMEKASGKGRKDVFKILIFNDGEEVLAKNLSGGQKQIVDAAIRIAIEYAVSNRSEKEYLTSFWDESDGAMDTERAVINFRNKLEYLEKTNKRNVFIVTHRTEVINEMDQFIRVEDL